MTRPFLLGAIAGTALTAVVVLAVVYPAMGDARVSEARLREVCGLSTAGGAP